MKIAIFTECYPPQKNGIAERFSMLASHWRSRDHTVDVYSITPQADYQFDYLNCDKLFKYQRPKDVLPSFCVGYLNPFNKTFDSFKSKKYDLVWVVIGFSFPLLFQLIHYTKEEKIPLVTSLHINTDDYIETYCRDEYLKKLFYLALPLYARLVYDSSYRIYTPNFTTVSRINFPQNKTRKIYSGVDKNCFYPQKVRKEKGLCLYVGRIAYEKNIFVLEKLFRIKGLKLIVVGDGELKSYLEEKWKDKPVTFLGQKNKEELPSLYSRAHFSIQPSLSETYGLTVIESMACGTPCFYKAIDVMKENFSSYGSEWMLEPISDLTNQDIQKIRDFLKLRLKTYQFSVLDWSEAADKTFEGLDF